MWVFGWLAPRLFIHPPHRPHPFLQVYGTSYPDLEEYSVKEPPPLPPHLRHIILNKVASRLSPRATTVIASSVR